MCAFFRRFGRPLHGVRRWSVRLRVLGERSQQSLLRTLRLAAPVPVRESPYEPISA